MLQSERIRLRAVNQSDLDTILRIENNKENWLVSSTKRPYTRDEIQGYISSISELESDGQFRWMLCNKESDVLGIIDLFEYDVENKRAGLGIIILKEYRKQGFAEESIRLMSEYCFNSLGLNQIWANILAINEQSIKLFEKCGFEKSGTKKKWIFHASQWIDMYFYQLMKS